MLGLEFDATSKKYVSVDCFLDSHYLYAWLWMDIA